MALRGTLKDFGIADIFQLIGHQTKSGILRMKGRDSDVAIHFREGNVIKAESATRQKKELLGHMLVRGGILSDEQLQEALDDQKRTLRRLGDVLTSRGMMTKEVLTEFMRLQATETIYRLFSWQAGTYEFEQVDVERNPEFGEPIRAESLLMEGFRMVDEWPLIRKKISGYGLTFEKLKELPEKKIDPDELDFGGDGDGGVGNAERKIYDLLTPDRDVQKLIDYSRLGEFDACKALTTLLDQGYLRVAGHDQKSKNPPLLQGGLAGSSRTMQIVLSLVVLVVVLIASVFVLQSGVLQSDRLGTSSATIPDTMKVALAESQRRRITQSLEVARLQDGHYPPSLNRLIELGLLEVSDLEFPVGKPFLYQPSDGRYALAPALP